MRGGWSSSSGWVSSRAPGCGGIGKLLASSAGVTGRAVDSGWNQGIECHLMLAPVISVTSNVGHVNFQVALMSGFVQRSPERRRQCKRIGAGPALSGKQAVLETAGRCRTLTTTA